MKKGFTLVELLAVIAILAILIIIALPNILKLFNEAQRKTFLVEVRSINKAAGDSYLSHKVGDTTPTETVYTYNDGVQSVTGNIKMRLSGQKPQNGVLIIRPNGETALALHNGKYCARKMFGSDEITLSNVTVDQCVLDNAPSGFTSELCFDFNSSTGTIETYFDYQNDNPSNPICPTDVVIPNKINGVNVIALADFSFAYHNYIVYNDTNQEDSVLLTSVVPENNTIYNLNKTFVYNNDNKVTKLSNKISLRQEHLTSVIIPEGVETIGDLAFIANNISSVVIPNSVTHIGSAAFERNSISSLVIGTGVKVLAENSFARNQLTNLVVPNNVTDILEGAFSYNELTSVSIGTGLNTVGEDVFQFNESLTSIEVNGNNPNIMSYNNALYTKDGQTLIIGTKASSNNMLNTTKIIENSAFTGMGVTSVTIPVGVITIKLDAFGNNELTSLAIPNSVTSIGDYAFHHNQLTSVTIGTGITTIGEYAFMSNKITQGNFKIDKASGSVSIGNQALRYNGSNGNTTITPTYLK